MINWTQEMGIRQPNLPAWSSCALIVPSKATKPTSMIVSQHFINATSTFRKSLAAENYSFLTAMSHKVCVNVF